MNLLPKASGSRPRLACELSAGGVVAGRSPEPGLPLAAVARADLPENAILPGLRPGNVADKVAVVAALRRVLEQVGARSNGRNAELTLVIPDAAVRVLLLDFDALPGKLSEALPIVRFRLKKLVPFDADHAMVSFQVMSTSRSMVRVLAVAIPRDVLGEYESAAREAGFEPGAVLPSTLSALAALQEGEGASLVVNAHAGGITTAIVRAGIVLLHRAVELAESATPAAGLLSSALLEPSLVAGNNDLLPPPATSEYGRNAYADRISTETATQDQDAVTATAVAPSAMGSEPGEGLRPVYTTEGAHSFDVYASAGGTGVPPQRKNDPGATGDEAPQVYALEPDVLAEEIARAISVAMAYFEDSLSAVPEVLLSTGPLSADTLNGMLRERGIALDLGVRVRELVTAEDLAPSATSVQVPRGWLGGITGALRS